MKRMKRQLKPKKINPILLIGSVLAVFLLFISVGFSALSTTLSINGTAAFTPVGMIRVMSITQDTLINATETNKSFTSNTINALININTYDGTATYNVNIKNLGQTDKTLTNITEEIFSNNECEYTLTGLAIGDVIEAHKSIDFKITFKYKGNVVTPIETGLNAKLKFIFDDYVPKVNYAYFKPYDGTENLFGLDKTGITSFEKSNLTKEEVLAKEGVTLISNVSDDKYNSEVDVYGYIENNKFYWWSSADIVYFHPNTKKAFSKFTDVVTVNLNGTSTEKVENFAHWFDTSRNLKEIIGRIDTSGLKLEYNPTFDYANDSNENTTSGYGLTYLFNDCNALETVDLSGIDTTNSSDLKRMFGGCKKLASVDVSHFNTKNARSMYWMFRNVNSMQELDISNFDTSNVENMFGMFTGSSILKTITLGSKFDTSKVKKFNNMFYNMPKLTTIYARLDFIRGANSTSNSMFYNDKKLVGAQGESYQTVFNSSKTNSQYAQIANQNQPGYFTLYGNAITTYTITYNLDGAVASNPSTYNEETEDFTLNPPIKTGYTFLGWTGDNGETPELSVTIKSGTKGNLTYNANFQKNFYTVIFNSNGGTGTMDNQTFEYDEYKSLTPNTYIHTDKNFMNWNTESNGTGVSISDKKVVGSLLETGNYNLYAQWYKPDANSQLVFNLDGPCTFNGNKGGATGSNCTVYAKDNTINTNISLFSSENIDTDFLISFDVDYTASSQDISQSTILNTFPETSNTGNPGIVVRKTNTNKIEIIARDGAGQNIVNISGTGLESFKIIRKNRKVCYSINNEDYKYLYSFENMTTEFDKPLSFASSIDKDGNVWRTINGTLSNIKVYLGKLDNDYECNSSMK